MSQGKRKSAFLRAIEAKRDAARQEQPGEASETEASEATPPNRGAGGGSRRSPRTKPQHSATSKAPCESATCTPASSSASKRSTGRSSPPTSASCSRTFSKPGTIDKLLLVSRAPRWIAPKFGHSRRDVVRYEDRCLVGERRAAAERDLLAMADEAEGGGGKL